VSIQRSSISELLHRIEDRVEEWREADRARKLDAEANRDRLWAEAAEREKLLEEAISNEEGERRTLEEAAKNRGTVFVVHSSEAGAALEEFASEGARLESVVPGREARGGSASGSWLVFERPRR
jgi:hypothetical protein